MFMKRRTLYFGVIPGVLIILYAFWSNWTMGDIYIANVDYNYMLEYEPDKAKLKKTMEFTIINKSEQTIYLRHNKLINNHKILADYDIKYISIDANNSYKLTVVNTHDLSQKDNQLLQQKYPNQTQINETTLKNCFKSEDEYKHSTLYFPTKNITAIEMEIIPKKNLEYYFISGYMGESTFYRININKFLFNYF